MIGIGTAPMSVGAWLKLQRKEQGMTRKQVADGMGVTKARIKEIESDDFDPRITTLSRYMHAIGKKLDFSLIPIIKEKP